MFEEAGQKGKKKNSEKMRNWVKGVWKKTKPFDKFDQRGGSVSTGAKERNFMPMSFGCQSTKGFRKLRVHFERIKG